MKKINKISIDKTDVVTNKTFFFRVFFFSLKQYGGAVVDTVTGERQFFLLIVSLWLFYYSDSILPVKEGCLVDEKCTLKQTDLRSNKENRPGNEAF